MATTLLVVVAGAFVAYRATTEVERANVRRYLRALIHGSAVAADKWYDTHESFFQELRARTRFAPATPILLVVNTAIFVVVFVANLVSGSDALVEWGATLGTRTTNDEWWRLVTSLFVHAGPFHLLASLMAILSIGFVLERLVGSVALAAVYVTSGIFAGLFTLFTTPLVVSTGASGAICGLYGLAFAVLLRGLVQQPRLTVPWGVLKWLAITCVIFLAYNMPSGSVPLRAELTGFIAGVLSGVAIGRGVSAATIPVKRTAILVAATGILAVVAAVPLRGITDVRPGIHRMLATDEHTAATFRAAASRLALGRTTAQAMIDLIEREIVPALEQEQPRLAPGRVVPDDQQAALAAAGEYVRLRIESWRWRAAAFRKGSLSMLRQADLKEGAARDFLARNPHLASSAQL